MESSYFLRNDTAVVGFLTFPRIYEAMYDLNKSEMKEHHMTRYQINI